MTRALAFSTIAALSAFAAAPLMFAQDGPPTTVVNKLGIDRTFARG